MVHNAHPTHTRNRITPSNQFLFSVQCEQRELLNVKCNKIRLLITEKVSIYIRMDDRWIQTYRLLCKVQWRIILQSPKSNMNCIVRWVIDFFIKHFCSSSHQSECWLEWISHLFHFMIMIRQNSLIKWTMNNSRSIFMLFEIVILPLSFNRKYISAVQNLCGKR